VLTTEAVVPSENKQESMMNTKLVNKELSDVELEAVTGGKDDVPLAPVIKAVALRVVDLDCYINNPPICPIPIQPH
jgi:hypothetical protein